ncbi:MAG TPA: hypothetical protein VLK65_08085 [Vicinamibacteria bacterium]|nr:hypothetical protein [Vicinamibacteria bacterium]
MDELPKNHVAGIATAPPFGEVLVCGCKEDDVRVLENARGPDDPIVRTVNRPAEMARQVVLRPPMAVFLGLRKRDRARLQLIPVLRAVRKELPLVIVADEPSLELERRARQEGIFYYFLHPLVPAEVEAVWTDLLRRASHEFRPRLVHQRSAGKKRSET